jgi:hypothetical protein
MAELTIVSYPSNAKADRLRALLALSRQAYLIQSALDGRSDNPSSNEETAPPKAGHRSR